MQIVFFMLLTLTLILFTGHIGHIDLPLPVCNPLFHQTILQILKLSCMTCGRFRMPEYLKKLFLVQQKLLERGLIIEAQQVLTNLDLDQTN